MTNSELPKSPLLCSPDSLPSPNSRGSGVPSLWVRDTYSNLDFLWLFFKITLQVFPPSNSEFVDAQWPIYRHGNGFIMWFKPQAWGHVLGKPWVRMSFCLVYGFPYPAAPPLPLALLRFYDRQSALLGQAECPSESSQKRRQPRFLSVLDLLLLVWV